MMKTPAILFALASLALPHAFAQNIGDTVTPEALGQAEWVKGSAPTAWEPGKLYILECWATWCGPCVAAIPHVDALYDKYHERGLNVFGMDVFEDGIDKVRAFVEKKGDGMSYPVSYTGKGGNFEKTWLTPAGVNAIPHAFLVKDGKVILMIHPALITEDLVEAILAGGEMEQRALAPLVATQRGAALAKKAQASFHEAAEKDDEAGMKAAVESLEQADPANAELDPMKLGLLVKQERWDDATTIVKRLPDIPKRTATISGIAENLMKKKVNAPPAFYRVLAENFGNVPVGGGGVYAMSFQSKIYWMAEDKPQAIASIKKTIELADTVEAGPFGKILHEPLEKTLQLMESADGGRLPTDEEFSAWVKEAADSAQKK